MYVEIKNINKTFGDYKASDNVNFGIERVSLSDFSVLRAAAKQQFFV